MTAGTVGWLPAQEHHGENIGDTPTHVIFDELKEPGALVWLDIDDPTEESIAMLGREFSQARSRRRQRRCDLLAQ